MLVLFINLALVGSVFAIIASAMLLAREAPENEFRQTLFKMSGSIAIAFVGSLWLLRWIAA
ncbi:hypothetical protein [Marivivens aquimaris]|uniref:hypothetical protein n=1 Tax=Marivivens aquimaris TaxID=2774876 RepID=UPI0018803500|nr:hypothetical protein [Marivivens aquimaris]